MSVALDLLLGFPPLQRALVAALLVAVLSAFLGVFVVLRGLSMLGDGLAHISFAGVALGLAVGLYPLPLALAFAALGALAIQFLRERAIVKGDTAIGILFTAGLAIGVVLVSYSGGFNVDVMSYLFGNLLFVTQSDVALIAVIGASLVVLFALLQKEFFYMTLNEEAARLSGLPTGVLNALFSVLTAASIVVAARIVGILLVSALLVVPAATSLQFSRSFRGTLALSVLFGVTSVVVGVVVATEFGLATGGSVALASTALFAGAVLVKGVTGRLGRAAG